MLNTCKGKMWLCAILSLVLCISAMPVMVSATGDLTDIFYLDFNNAPADSGSRSPSADTMQSWMPNGYTRGISISGSAANLIWGISNSAPDQETHRNVLRVSSNAAAETVSNNYMIFTFKNFQSKYNTPAALSCEADGYADYSFDFYTDGETPIQLQLRWCIYEYTKVDGSTVTDWLEPASRPFINISKNGTLDIFNGRTGAFKSEGLVSNNTWHNLRVIITADSKYEVVLDGNIISPLKELDLPPKDTTAGSDFKLRGIDYIWLYNLSEKDSPSTKYYDNFRYSVGKLSPVLAHTNEKIAKYFAGNDGLSVPTVYAKPDTTVADFMNGLTAAYPGGKTVTCTLKDESGDDIEAASGAVMADAATLQMEVSGGNTYEAKVITDAETTEVLDNGLPGAYGIGFGQWIYTGQNGQDGYYAQSVPGLGGKDKEDNSVQISSAACEAEQGTNYFDLYLNGQATDRAAKGASPITLAFSLYTNRESNPVSLQLVGAPGFSANETLNFGTDSAPSERWNRYAVSLYPNSNRYICYINGEKTNEGELSTVTAGLYNKIRFVFKADGESDFYALDNVSLTAGAYEYAQKDIALTTESEVFQADNEAGTLKVLSDAAVENLFDYAGENGYTDVRVYTDSSLNDLAEEGNALTGGNVLVVSDGNGMYRYYTIEVRYTINAEKAEDGTVTVSVTCNREEDDLSGAMLILAQYRADDILAAAAVKRAEGSEKTFSSTLNPDDEAVQSINAYLWDSATLKPLSGVVRFEIERIPDKD